MLLQMGSESWGKSTVVRKKMHINLAVLSDDLMDDIFNDIDANSVKNHSHKRQAIRHAGKKSDISIIAV